MRATEERPTDAAPTSGNVSGEYRCVRPEDPALPGEIESSGGLALIGADGRWLAVSRSLCELLGYTEAEMQATTTTSLTWPDDVDSERANLAALLAGDTSESRFLKRLVRRDGSTVCVETRMAVVRDPRGVPRHFVAQIWVLEGAPGLETQVDERVLRRVSTTTALAAAALRGMAGDVREQGDDRMGDRMDAIADSLDDAAETAERLRSSDQGPEVPDLLLPTGASESPPLSDVRLAAHAPRVRALVVDDDPKTVASLVRALEAENDVVATTSAREALGWIRDNGERYDVILCGLMMPGMTGMDLHAELLAVCPEQARHMAFMAGGASTVRAREFLDSVDNEFLGKPIDLDSVRDLVRSRRSAAHATSTG